MILALAALRCKRAMTGIDKSTKKKCQRREGIYKKPKKRKSGERKSESFGGDMEGLDQQVGQGGTFAIFLAKYISGLPLDRNRLYWSQCR